MTLTDSPAEGTIVAATTGLAMYYRAWGSLPSAREGTPSCLLLHGLGSSSHIWDLVAPLLVERGILVVAADQRGHGQTAQPLEGYDMATLAADARGLAHALGLDRPLVVGHSWGASVALACAAEQPAEVTGAVLVDGGLAELRGRPGASWERMQQQMAQPDLSTTRMADVLRDAAGGELRELDPRFRAAFIASMLDEQADGTVRSRLAGAQHRQILRGLWEQDHAGQLLRVRTAGTPLLAIVSSQTTFEGQVVEFLAANRAGAAALRERVPHAEVLWMEDTIHDIPLQRPVELAAAIAGLMPRNSA